MTVLEIMIVLAILAGGALLVRSGFRMISKADLVENATEVAGILRRVNQLAIELGEMHRVVFDIEKGVFQVEVCQGATTIVREEQLHRDPEEVKAAIERGKQRLDQLPEDALAAGDAEEATRRATAIAGHHVADRQCSPASSGMSGFVNAGDKCTNDDDCRGSNSCKKIKDDDKYGYCRPPLWRMELYANKGIKFKNLWVQHRETAVTKGSEAIYFFPQGASEKAVVEITDGSETFSVVVHGLTGRVELRDGELRSVDDHMLRNALGNKDADRDAKDAPR